MRTLLLLLLASFCLSAQDAGISLPMGEYAVGFAHYDSVDSTRQYRRVFDWSNAWTYRELPVSVWYPAVPAANGAAVSVLDYMRVLKAEEDWEHLPDEYLLDWFAYPDTPERQAKLAVRSGAFHQLEAAAGTFPVIVYTPGYERSSIENFRLCEYLASHGCVVIATPSRGAESRWLSNGAFRDIEAQARDMEYLIKEAVGKWRADAGRVYGMGYSFGGLASVYLQSRNPRIKGLVSLDGADKYQYDKLRQIPDFDAARVDVPYVHFSQKDIPEALLKEEGLTPGINTDFVFFDSLRLAPAYQLRCEHLSHSYFTTLGVLWQERDPRQDVADEKILAAYQSLCVFVQEFVESLERPEGSYSAFLARELAQAEPAAQFTRLAEKIPTADTVYSFEDFNDTAAAADYQDLAVIHRRLESVAADFQLPEWKLNNLGLQLTFAPGRYAQGIRVFQFALTQYPNSANLYDSLGEAYWFGNEKDLARRAFARSLELNPENTNAIKRLGSK